MGKLPQARLHGGNESHPLAYMKKTTMLCLAVCAGLVSQGCKSISTSFAFDQRILIKVPYSGEPRAAISSSGWRFKPLVQATTNVQQTVPAEWFMAWPPADKRYQLSRSHSAQAWKEIRRFTPELADIVHDVFGEFPMVIEPNLIFGRDALAPAVVKKKDGGKSSGPPEVPVLLAHAGPSKVWPMRKTTAGKSRPLWYQDDNFSQLRAARELVESNTPKLNGVIRIGFLDCGFDSTHAAMPELIEDDPAGNAVNLLRARDE